MVRRLHPPVGPDEALWVELLWPVPQIITQSLIHYVFFGILLLQWKAVTVTPSEIGISQEQWHVSQNGFGSP